MFTNPTRTYVDLDLNFNPNPITGDVTKTVGDMAVIAALKYLIQTNHWEVPFNPDQGTNVEKLLFENAGGLTAAALQKEITNAIKNYEKRVTINQIIVTPDINNNAFNVLLSVFILGNINPTTVNMFLSRV